MTIIQDPFKKYDHYNEDDFAQMLVSNYHKPSGVKIVCTSIVGCRWPESFLTGHNSVGTVALWKIRLKRLKVCGAGNLVAA